tara:strand:+ start:130 stop:1116 length:987 start_codon:yes stop_codon:yes gene_type:complete
MKIFVFGSSRIGGVRIVSKSLTNSLESLGYDAEYIYGYNALKKIFKNFFNIYFSTKDKYYFITWGIYNFLPLPAKNVLCFMHGFPSANQQDLLRFYLFRSIIILNKIRKIRSISVSKFSHSILKDIYKLDTQVLRNSIPFTVNKENLTHDLEKDIDIIFIGRVNNYKMPIFMLDTLEHLATKGKNIYVVGEGTSKDNYLKHNNATNIVFSDFVARNEVSLLLKRSKYFISCSDSEPFGIVFLEALLFGCKLISPRSGGLLEISSHFPKEFIYLFNFYDNEYDAKEILKNLNYKIKSISSIELKLISEIIDKKFNPIKHAIDIIKLLNT